MIEIGLLKDREKKVDRVLAFVKMKFASAKVENASVRWSREDVDERATTLEKDVNLVLKVVAGSV